MENFPIVKMAILTKVLVKISITFFTEIEKSVIGLEE
jgi:hypothetical protein